MLGWQRLVGQDHGHRWRQPGLGRGIARAFAEAGAAVVAVARTGPALAELATASANIRTEVADAADATG